MLNIEILEYRIKRMGHRTPGQFDGGTRTFRGSFTDLFELLSIGSLFQRRRHRDCVTSTLKNFQWRIFVTESLIHLSPLTNR